MLRTHARSPSILLTALVATMSPARAQTLAITGATILDGTGKSPVSDGVVLISDGRITAVGRSRDVAIPQGAGRLDARGKYLIPGLMDAHVHTCCGDFVPGLETLVKYEGRYHEIVVEAAQVALKSGVTTIFDTWGPRAALVQARDMINAGAAPGSRIYLAGNAIGWDGPLSAEFNGEAAGQVSKAFVTRTNDAWEQGTGRTLLSTTPEEVRVVVRAYAQQGVDFLKYAGTSHHGQHFSHLTFSPRVQRLIVEEGHRAGLTVQAHTTSLASLDLAIDAGVDILSHGDNTGPHGNFTGRPVIPEATIRKLVERGTAVVVRPFTQRHLDALERQPKLYPHGLAEVERINQHSMIKAGVRMLLSTDGVLESPVRPEETRTQAVFMVDPRFTLGEGHFNALVGLEELGMDRMEILKSATSHIARAYKLDGTLGTLQPGKMADLVILDANPLESARNYRRIHAVIKEGKVVDRDALPVAPIISAKPRLKTGRQSNKGEQS